MALRGILVVCGLVMLTACGAPAPVTPLSAHLHTDPARTDAVAAMPSAASVPFAPPSPGETPAVERPGPAEETYDVSVRDIPVRDLLFVLAQEAKLNLDLHQEVRGEITLNAVNQSLPRLFARIARQAAIRFERDGDNLFALPDMPYLRHYKVDYVNLSRHVSGTVATSTQIATSAASGGSDAVASSLDSGNVSSTRVENATENQFWTSLGKNIRDLLLETGESLPEGVNPVIVHPESGVVTVRATHLQHARVREFIRRVEQASRRQVMIEATIVEVELDDNYQQGIEWSRVWAEGNKELGVTPPALANSAHALATPFVLDFTRHANPLSLTLKLLQSFGTTKVLSSPRLSVLNNQTALLKIVENVVYFSIKAEVTPGNSNSNPVVAYTSTPQTVSVGLVMTVTPQISNDDSVILNVRPTISSISGMVKDPNPDIPSTVSNEIPQIRTREIESVLRVANGEITVLGGLMEDRIDYARGRIPLLGQIPIAGELFTVRNNMTRKSELVVFLRPVIIREPALRGDYAALRAFLPGPDFLAPPSGSEPFDPAFPSQER
ncbi:MAG: secretin N-terminal domain-containing protein [Zoogloeaceae bacterium]|jgi:general secretion pathway protein D|nr:secretin N-terminal domain-containing protein [Zoogloeaceae bacterium]